MILAVRRTPNAMGRISRLIVSIRIINGIRGVGEPSGSRWASEIDGFFVIPVITVAIHSGMARVMFMDSWEVGVNVYGSRPNRFDRRISRSRLVRTWHHFCPTWVNWFVMFVIIVFNSQMMAVVIRLFKSFGLLWINRAGINIDSRIVGTCRNTGLANCSNMFMFMAGLVLVFVVL